MTSVVKASTAVVVSDTIVSLWATSPPGPLSLRGEGELGRSLSPLLQQVFIHTLFVHRFAVVSGQVDFQVSEAVDYSGLAGTQDSGRGRLLDDCRTSDNVTPEQPVAVVDVAW